MGRESAERVFSILNKGLEDAIEEASKLYVDILEGPPPHDPELDKLPTKERFKRQFKRVDITLWFTKFISAYARWWVEEAPERLEESEKYISLLSTFHLDLTEERERLKEEKTKMDEIMDALKDSITNLDSEDREISLEAARVFSAQSETMDSLMEDFDIMRRSLQKHAFNALALVSQTTTNIGSSALFELMTKEP